MIDSDRLFIKPCCIIQLNARLTHLYLSLLGRERVGRGCYAGCFNKMLDMRDPYVTNIMVFSNIAFQLISVKNNHYNAATLFGHQD